MWFQWKNEIFLCCFFYRLKSIIQEVARDYRGQFHRWVLALWTVPLFLFNCVWWCSKPTVVVPPAFQDESGAEVSRGMLHFCTNCLDLKCAHTSQQQTRITPASCWGLGWGLRQKTRTSAAPAFEVGWCEQSQVREPGGSWQELREWRDIGISDIFAVCLNIVCCWRKRRSRQTLHYLITIPFLLNLLLRYQRYILVFLL